MNEKGFDPPDTQRRFERQQNAGTLPDYMVLFEIADKYTEGVRRIRAALVLFQVGDNPPMPTDREIGWMDALGFALTALGAAAKAVIEKEARK